jgi:23S rRNA (uracil1939-C5)-methyltransferase
VVRKRNRKKRIPEGLFQASIDSLTSDARGVARIDGKATFIDGALPGETVQFRYTRCKSRFDEGIVETVITASADRVEPKCPYHLLCGGCSLQHLSADAQITLKQQSLLDSFTQIGKVEPDKVMLPLTGDRWGYRRKARLGVRDVKAKGRVLVGFREKSNRYLADIHSCEVLHPSVGQRLDELSDLIGRLHARQTIAQIEVAVSDEQTALVFRHLEPLDEHDRQLLTDYARQTGLYIYLQPGGVETITPLWPLEPALSYGIPDYGVEISFLPSDFTQVNASINQQMVKLAIDLLQLQSDDHVLDLFCGLGNFTAAIASRGNRVTGVEADAGLIERARQNATNNQLDNIHYHVANLFEDISLQSWSQQPYDKLLLDPPRSGAQAVAEQIRRINPKRIVYVSCHPASLARDAGILVSNGYRLVQAGVMDMFPHTMHVESIAVFEKS